jgi:hypothetical protein
MGEAGVTEVPVEPASRPASLFTKVPLGTLHSAADQVRRARETGALVHLQFALTYLARTHLLTGELATAARLIEEDSVVAEATGNPPFRYSAMMLAAWRGQEDVAAELIQATTREAAAGSRPESVAAPAAPRSSRRPCRS